MHDQSYYKKYNQTILSIININIIRKSWNELINFYPKERKVDPHQFYAPYCIWMGFRRHINFQKFFLVLPLDPEILAGTSYFNQCWFTLMEADSPLARMMICISTVNITKKTCFDQLSQCVVSRKLTVNHVFLGIRLILIKANETMNWENQE